MKYKVSKQNKTHETYFSLSIFVKHICFITLCYGMTKELRPPTNTSTFQESCTKEGMTPFVSKSPKEAFQNYKDLDIGAKLCGSNYFKCNFGNLINVY